MNLVLFSIIFLFVYILIIIPLAYWILRKMGFLGNPDTEVIVK